MPAIIYIMGRAASVEQGHHLIADGALKFNESKVNSLSNFSRKAKVKGSRDISVIYAYNLEIQEPICSECFPGNMLDMTASHRLIQDCVSRKKLLPFTAEYAKIFVTCTGLLRPFDDHTTERIE